MEASGENPTTKVDYSSPRMTSGHDMGIVQYFATRIPTLKPPMAKAPNPIRLLGMLSSQQWMFFLVAFLGWTWDAFDFFTVPLGPYYVTKDG